MQGKDMEAGGGAGEGKKGNYIFIHQSALLERLKDASIPHRHIHTYLEKIGEKVA